MTNACDDLAPNIGEDIVNNACHHTPAHAGNLSTTAADTHIMTNTNDIATNTNDDETTPAMKRARHTKDLSLPTLGCSDRRTESTHDESRRPLEFVNSHDDLDDSNRPGITDSLFDKPEQIDKPAPQPTPCVLKFGSVVHGLYKGESVLVGWCCSCRNFKDGSTSDIRGIAVRNFCDFCYSLSDSKRRKRKPGQTDGDFQRDALHFFYKDTQREISFCTSCPGYQSLENMSSPNSCDYHHETKTTYWKRLRQGTADCKDLQWDEIHLVDYTKLSRTEVAFYLQLRGLPYSKRPKADMVPFLEKCNEDLARKEEEEADMLHKGIPFDIGKMQASVGISILRLSSGSADDLAMSEAAEEWHSYARRQFKNHFEMEDTITTDPVPITKFNTSARTDKCWLLDLDSALPHRLEYVSPESHILLMIKGRDGLWTESKPRMDFYARCGTKDVSVLFPESVGRLLGEPMRGWNGIEDGTTQVWSRFESSDILDSFESMAPTPLCGRLLKRWGIDCAWRNEVGDAIRGRRLSFRNRL